MNKNKIIKELCKDINNKIILLYAIILAKSYNF